MAASMSGGSCRLRSGTAAFAGSVAFTLESSCSATLSVIDCCVQSIGYSIKWQQSTCGCATVAELITLPSAAESPCTHTVCQLMGSCRQTSDIDTSSSVPATDTALTSGCATVAECDGSLLSPGSVELVQSSYRRVKMWQFQR